MKTSQRVKDLIASMSLQEKAAQLTQFCCNLVFADTEAEATGDVAHFNIAEYGKNLVGSVLNFGACDRQKIVEDIQKRYDCKIPVIFMMDIVHGCRTIYPIPLALGCSFEEKLVEECAEMAGKEALAAGVDLTFSPMVDLARDARWGRVMETTGEDHFLNGEMGKAFIRGYHKAGLACCVKHYAAYGAAEAGRDYNTTDMSDFVLQEYYLHSYRECMKEKPEMVMSSFNCLNGRPVNANEQLLVKILREDWGFDGVLISDYNAIEEMVNHGYAGSWKECAETALNNEIDIEMQSVTYLAHLAELVQEGKVSEEKIDKMLERVLNLKEKLGLFENPIGKLDAEAYEKMIFSPEHRAIARKAAEKSFVLLKNGGLLPLKKSDKVAMVGPLAKQTNINGFWWAYGRGDDPISLHTALQNYLGKEVPCEAGCSHELLEKDFSKIPSAISVTEGADVVLACIGEFGSFSGEGNSRANPCVPAVQVELCRQLKKAGKKVVGVIFAGRPLILTDVEPYLDSILYVWQTGCEGGNAIVNTLYGMNNPAGKTTMSFPRSVGQCPIHYNELHTGRRRFQDDLEHTRFLSSYLDELNAPLYPFGFGLSYTKFELSDFALSKAQMTADEKVTASITVKNVGEYDGEEVVQLYLRDRVSKLVRPIKELKGYKKVFVKKGEEVTVSFEITVDTLSYHNGKGEFIYECGEFDIMLGNSSMNVLRGQLDLIEK